MSASSYGRMSPEQKKKMKKPMDKLAKPKGKKKVK